MADQSRVALVTGASRGIGPYIARSLAGAGYRLVLTGRSASELNALAHELNAVAVPADLTRPDDLEALVEVAQRELGGVDVLVNNAGGDPQREFDAMSWQLRSSSSTSSPPCGSLTCCCRGCFGAAGDTS
jgi:NADP-dependent 3-hydroxy acid dehydrogenase YdfG